MQTRETGGARTRFGFLRHTHSDQLPPASPTLMPSWYLTMIGLEPSSVLLNIIQTYSFGKMKTCGIKILEKTPGDSGVWAYGCKPSAWELRQDDCELSGRTTYKTEPNKSGVRCQDKNTNQTLITKGAAATSHCGESIRRFLKHDRL